MGETASLAISDSAVGGVRIATARALALIPAGAALILYGITCSPTVNFTDSGELITVAWTGGIAHPPGYPLYTMISGLFVHLPLGNPAWRMNLLSALFAAGAVGLFYLLVTETLSGMAAFQRALARREPATPARPAVSGKAARPTPAPAPRNARTPVRAVSAPKERRPAAPPPAGERASAVADSAEPTRAISQ